MMKKMTITEALRELSLYDEKIAKALTGKQFIGIARGTEEKKVLEHVEKQRKADYESVVQIIKNRDEIKAAVMLSNAITKVNVDGKEMTVTEAIDRKHSIEYKEELLRVLEGQYAQVLKRQDQLEDQLEKEVREMLMQIAGSDASGIEDKREILEQAYRKTHEYKLVDPIGVEAEIEKLHEEIDGFRADIDTQLALSNAVTFIEVEM